MIRFLLGFLLGVLLTSIYYNPEQTKKIVNKAIDFISVESKNIANHKEDIEKTYQKAKDLTKGWDQ